jgi:phosphoribosylanthranilate isomerase
MLKTVVKISKVNNLSDARYCAGMGVDLLGFSMDEIPVEKFREMRGWLAGVQIVGETSSTDVDAIREMVENFQPDYIQVASFDVLESLQVLGLPLILRVDFATDNLPALFQSTAALVDTFLVESSDDFAHLDQATVNLLDAWAFKYPILVGFGITESNVNEVLEQVPAKGVALSGGQEIRPGYSEMDDLMNVLEVLETED